MTDALATLLADLVAIDSSNPAMGGPADGQARLGALVESIARDRGLSVRRQPLSDGLFNVLVWHEADARAPWIVFDAHLDTVSTANMSIDPLAARVADGRLFGRGSCDVKASIAAMLVALDGYANRAASNNVALTLTCDEEVGKTGVHALVADGFAVLPGGAPMAAIVCEPTGLLPVVAHGGVVRWSIVTEGRATHSSDPSMGRSAISAMARVIAWLEAEWIPALAATHPLVGRACASINQIVGGTAINIIPDRCEIRVDRRLVPGENGGAVLTEVERSLDALRAREPNLVVRQLAPFIDPPFIDDANRAWAATVQASLRACGRSEDARGARYGTHASQFAAAGVPTLVLGPGDIAQAHTADEWVDLAEVTAAASVYERVMRSPLDGRTSC